MTNYDVHSIVIRQLYGHVQFAELNVPYRRRPHTVTRVTYGRRCARCVIR